MRDDLTEALSTDDLSQGIFSTSERVMLQNILRLTERRVIDVMVPRADLSAVADSIMIGDLLQVFKDKGHSRLPVYGDTVDDPRGMVLVKDLLLHLVTSSGGGKVDSKSKNVKLDFSQIDLDQRLCDLSIIRPIIFVPPSMLAADLMNRMQIARIQMALVIDEHGGTGGLITLEDIIEEVVGEISDEHDEDDDDLIHSIDEHIWSVDARANLTRVRGVIGTHFNPLGINDEVDTVGGLVFALAGHIPVRGEVIRGLDGLSDFEFRVMEADVRRVRRLQIVQTESRPPRRTKAKSTDESDD